MRLLPVFLYFLASGALLAQHAYTTGDIENGGRLYRATCAVCHGPDGDLIPGIDFGHGKFRRATDDENIEQIIIKGIPGTGMPSNNVTEQQADNIVAYLRSLPASARPITSGGNAARGRAIFQGKGNCQSCHRVRGVGSRMAPDLTDVGALRRTAEIEQSILDPDAEILPDNRFIKVLTKDGAEVTGRLLNVDTFTLQMMDSQEKLRFFQKTDLREYSPIKKSPMPSYKGKLSNQELADLVSYLVSLKGI